jgi:NAD(P)-dependent dehydrogenase (short-subunit alcohol dehydrogenase family)
MSDIQHPNETVKNYQAPARLLQDRIIVVTGAGDGIGRAAAKSFAAHGANVVLLGRTVEKLERVYDEIESAGGPQPAIYPLDLETANYDHFYEMQQMLGKEFGRLDGLLHNASILGQRTPIEYIKPDDWQKIMQVNVNAVFLMTKALLPLLNESDDASIVLTSSGVGRQGRAFWGAYAVSKFATEGFMQVLADELENISTIRVNSINPGATNTAMRRLAYPGEVAESNPSPEEIMKAYLYLLGPDSKGVSGQALNAQ